MPGSFNIFSISAVRRLLFETSATTNSAAAIRRLERQPFDAGYAQNFAVGRLTRIFRLMRIFRQARGPPWSLHLGGPPKNRGGVGVYPPKSSICS